MRRPPLFLIVAAILGLVLAACSGSPSGSEPGPSDGGGEPSTAAESDAPAESQDGGGGGGGGIGTGSGSVQFEMSGGHSVSDELPFAGNFAYFQQAGVSLLVFTDDTDADEANGVIITLGLDGSDENNVFQYITDEVLIPAADCTWNITRHDATGAAGSFECNDQAGLSTSSGGAILDIDIRGDFEASN
jgi:hypothetical protein